MLTRLLDVISYWACHSSSRQRQSVTRSVAGILFGLYQLSPYRHFIQNNIAQALDLPPREQRALAKKHLENLLNAIVILLRFPLFAQNAQPAPVQWVGYEHFLSAYEQGQGVILVSAHFGCWELFPAMLGQKGIDVQVLVQRPSVAAFDRYFNQSRGFAQVKTAYNDTLSGLRPVLRALKQGQVLGMLIDQHGESNQIFGTFFGHRVSMPEGPYFLAQKTGAWIVPVFTYREGENHLIEFLPGLQARHFENASQLLQSLYADCESMIRRYPQEWLWSYNRWDKYQPCPRCLQV